MYQQLKWADMSVFEAHDHARCVSRSLEEADARAAQDGLRLTKTRRRVLEILLEGHRAMGAYDILERLRAEGYAAQPPVAYRALDFLTQNGLAHRIERLNAYIACTGPDAPHAPMFMICRSCEAVAEAKAALASDGISKVAKEAGFSIEAVAIEAEGLCLSCAQEADA